MVGALGRARGRSWLVAADRPIGPGPSTSGGERLWYVQRESEREERERIRIVADGTCLVWMCRTICS